MTECQAWGVWWADRFHRYAHYQADKPICPLHSFFAPIAPNAYNIPLKLDFSGARPSVENAMAVTSRPGEICWYQKAIAKPSGPAYD